jgi:hypothetical protein
MVTEMSLQPRSTESGEKELPTMFSWSEGRRR